MESTFKLAPVIAFMLLSLLSSKFSTARMLDSQPPLAARLTLDEEEEGSSTCLDSFLQLQSCTGEVVLFFLNGETYLGPSCCQAIKVIERDCLSTMLGPLGYTSEEGDILRGYCDANDDSVDIVSTTQSPPEAN